MSNREHCKTKKYSFSFNYHFLFTIYIRAVYFHLNIRDYDPPCFPPSVNERLSKVSYKDRNAMGMVYPPIVLFDAGTAGSNIPVQIHHSSDTQQQQNSKSTNKTGMQFDKPPVPGRVFWWDKITWDDDSKNKCR